MFVNRKFFVSFFDFYSFFKRVNHKSVGSFYLVLGYWSALGGSILSIIIRGELSCSGGILLSGNGQLYNSVLTLHGILMVFFVVIPILISGFGNWMLPMFLGAPEIAFPRANAISFWLTFIALFMVYFSFFVGGGAGTSWTLYPPLSTEGQSEFGTDLMILGLHTVGLASLMGSINFMVTVHNMRSTSVSLDQISLYVWTVYLSSFLLVLSVPVLARALLFLLLDRNFNTSFYDFRRGGSPLLYQHLFWFFGHPEVYIIILPAFGIVSECVLHLSDKERLFGQIRIIFASIWIAVLGTTVWGHHMYTAGLDIDTRVYFRAATMVIAVPRAVKIFNWLATLYGSRQVFQPLWCWTFRFILMFATGGITGIILSSARLDTALHDTYYVVAHFHYTLSLGAVYGIFCGFSLWAPYIIGVCYDKVLMYCVFACFFVGTNITFFPMHWVGIAGMPRKVIDCPDQWLFLQRLSSAGSIITFLGFILFNYILYDMIKRICSVCEFSYNFRRPAYSSSICPLPDTYGEQVFFCGYSWYYMSDGIVFGSFRRVGHGFFTK